MSNRRFVGASALEAMSSGLDEDRRWVHDAGGTANVNVSAVRRAVARLLAMTRADRAKSRCLQRGSGLQGSITIRPREQDVDGTPPR